MVGRRGCAAALVAAGIVVGIPSCHSSSGTQVVYESEIVCAPEQTLCGLPVDGGDTGAIDAGDTGDGGPIPYCANLQKDSTNCGACGTSCPVATSCVAGRCASIWVNRS